MIRVGEMRAIFEKLMCTVALGWALEIIVLKCPHDGKFPKAENVCLCVLRWLNFKSLFKFTE